MSTNVQLILLDITGYKPIYMTILGVYLINSL